MPSDLTRLEIVTKAADYLSRSLTAVSKSGATVQSVLEEMYEWSQLRLSRAYSFPFFFGRLTLTTSSAPHSSPGRL